MHSKQPFIALVLLLTMAVVIGVLWSFSKESPASGVSSARASSASSARATARPHPALMIWAWERPTDLRFINPKKTGVAFLAATVSLAGDRVIFKPRLQPLRIPDDTYLQIVIRIEPSRVTPPTLSEQQLAELLRHITEGPYLAHGQAMQIDFDCLQSQRPFYTKLIELLKKSLPAKMPLSMTSLASWCLRDPWIKNLPVDEVVPMLFCMGRDRERMIQCLKADGLTKMPQTQSIGLSVEEADVLAALNEKPQSCYLFSPSGWSSKRAINWIKCFEGESTSGNR